MNTESYMKTYKHLYASLLMEHQIVYQRMKSHDQLSNHLTIQSSKKVTEMPRVMLTADTLMSEVIPSMPKLSMLSTAVKKEENPDHGEWDTDVM